MSFLPPVKKMSHVTTMWFRLKIQDILYKCTNTVAKIPYQDIQGYQENMPISLCSSGLSAFISDSSVGTYLTVLYY
jgi:hypothetical protein